MTAARHRLPPTLPRIDTRACPLDPRGDLRWIDLAHLPLAGVGWPLAERRHPGDRFPARAEGKIPPTTWQKTTYAAGLHLDFHSNTDRVFLRWTDRAGEPPRTKPSTMRPDLYIRDRGRWRWAGLCSNLLAHDRAWIVDDMPMKPRYHRLYLGYLDGLQSLQLGLAPRAWIAPLAPRVEKPVVFYGTSITCGQSASRAGLTWCAQVGRLLDTPVINLGLPGHGKMEPEVVQFIAEIDAAVLVIACCENMDARLLAARTPGLVRTLRSAHPTAPIVLVESLLYENAWLIRSHARRVSRSNQALRQSYAGLKRAGIQHLHYLASDKLLPRTPAGQPVVEATADGTHLNDLGATHLAQVLAPFLARLLK